MDDNKNFVIVDDDKLVTLFCSMMIRKAYPEANVKTFESPEMGLEYFKSNFGAIKNEKQICLFLDINMPTMSGWEFLELFEELTEEIKDRIKIHILSSSVDARDIDRAENNKLVDAYFTKPLTREMLMNACESVK